MQRPATIINLMKRTVPFPLTEADWREIVKVPAVREAWGLPDDQNAQEFAASVYAGKFKFQSGSPGYVGDLYILQGDALTDRAPMVLKRNEDGALAVIEFFESAKRRIDAGAHT
jgi:hypothetical protein